MISKVTAIPNHSVSILECKQGVETAGGGRTWGKDLGKGLESNLKLST